MYTINLILFHLKAGPVIPPERILSGISAEMADYRSGSDEEDQEIQAPRHKFTQPDHVKMLLKSKLLKFNIKDTNTS